MKIVFTICSNNYLAQAKTLGDSILIHNPDYKFYIGLVDRLSSEINYTEEIKHEIILVEEAGIEGFDELWKKYNVIELNTSVKPMYFEHFFNKFPKAEIILYLDPDTMLVNPLNILEKEFNQETSVLLTPHIVSPIPNDGHTPFENTFLNFGLYNLGFLGLKRDPVTFKLLAWWKERTFQFGYMKVSSGLFVDQLWFNLVPLFFDKVKILKNLGYNMAPWNLHERKLTHHNKNYFINNKDILTFYHFSNYKHSSPDQIAKYYTRYKLSDFPPLKSLYADYRRMLVTNAAEKYEKIECHFVKMRSVLLKTKQEQNQIELMKKNKILLVKYYLKKFLNSFKTKTR